MPVKKSARKSATKKAAAKKEQPMTDHEIPAQDPPVLDPEPQPPRVFSKPKKRVICEYRGAGGKLIRKYEDHTKEVIENE